MRLRMWTDQGDTEQRRFIESFDTGAGDAVVIPREAFQDSRWLAHKFTPYTIYMDLIGRAEKYGRFNYRLANKYAKAAKKITLHQGQVLITYTSDCKRWNLCRNAAKKYIRMMEAAGLIHLEVKDGYGVIVTIKNYTDHVSLKPSAEGIALEAEEEAVLAGFMAAATAAVTTTDTTEPTESQSPLAVTTTDITESTDPTKETDQTDPTEEDDEYRLPDGRMEEEAPLGDLSDKEKLQRIINDYNALIRRMHPSEPTVRSVKIFDGYPQIKRYVLDNLEEVLETLEWIREDCEMPQVRFLELLDPKIIVKYRGDRKEKMERSKKRLELLGVPEIRKLIDEICDLDQQGDTASEHNVSYWLSKIHRWEHDSMTEFGNRLKDIDEAEELKAELTTIRDSIKQSGVPSEESNQ